MRTTPATRQFTDDPLSDDVLYDILDNARFGPNGGNRQGWHVIVLRDQERKEHIADLWDVGMREDSAFYDVGLVPFVASEAYRRNPPGQASEQPVDLETARSTPRQDGRAEMAEAASKVPVILLVCVDLSKVTAMDSGLGRLSISAGGSVYPFCHNILLAARDHGYGGVVTTQLIRQEAAVREYMGIPDDYILAAAIPLGKPAKEITKLRRNPVEDFATLDHFDGPQFERP